MVAAGAQTRRTEVAVIHKALDLLESLAASPSTAAELSARIDMAKPTVYRILRTLQTRGFIAKELDGTRYMLGSAFHALGSAARSSGDLVSLARPFLIRLGAEFEETVNLAIPLDGQIFYIDVLESGHRLRTHIPVGTRDNLHSTALGKAILAALPEPETRAILMSIDRVARTPTTLVTIPALLQQAKRIREKGYAVDNEENELGSVCVASVFRGHDGRPVGAISVSGPLGRMQDDLVETIGLELVQVCKSLSDALGSVEVIRGEGLALSKLIQ
ncbi:MAG: IclR family transcriptional regulator [Acidimicrobiales bacterium]